MVARSRRKHWGRLSYLLVGALALTASGCLAVAAGTAIVAGGAVAGAYLTGGVDRDYKAGIQETLTATKLSLTDFGMTLSKEKTENDNVFLESVTGSGQNVLIHIKTRLSEVPADGPISTVEVRVGPLGDRSMPERFGAPGAEKPLSERLLSQIGGRLQPQQRVVPVAAPVGAPVQQMAVWTSLPNAPQPLQTPPPPLALPSQK